MGRRARTRWEAPAMPWIDLEQARKALADVRDEPVRITVHA